ncbi:Polyadenylate-binding protein-interacting protein 10 [Zea mays]|nr:Polyadenylate-binding protein-interacting protein 10 [Zea mays]
MVSDASEAISFICNDVVSFGGDPYKIYLMGQSAGAHIATCALLQQAIKESKLCCQSYITYILIFCALQSDDEREMCARTIYCTNIDKKVTQADLKLFFESRCGEVGRSLLQTKSPLCTGKSLQKWHHQDRSGDQQDHGLHQV